MSQRQSGYAREARDKYQTPAWVTDALIPHLPRRPEAVWEPAAGDGKMAAALRAHGLLVLDTDIATGKDFLKEKITYGDVDAIITNPPYSFSCHFIQKAIQLTSEFSGVVAMLLRVDYDSAKSRQNLFGQSFIFHKKVVLTKRIVWFEDKAIVAAPSYNHAWFIWDWQNKGAPTLAYEPCGHLVPFSSHS